MKLFIKSYCIFALVFSAFLLLGSCKKYLDKKSDSTLIVPSTLSDMQALLDGVSVMNQRRTPCYGEVSSDEYFISPTNFKTFNDGDQKRYTWQYYFFGTGNDWSACYQPVYYSNLVLDLLTTIPLNNHNKQQWENVKGSALFYRSYYFLCLLWNYAKAYDSISAEKDLGIALRLTSNFNVPSTRANNQECYQQVINDIKTAIPLLPDYPQHVFRPSKGAAYGLLARCFLSMRDYANALKYADSSLQLNNQLMDLNGDNEIPSGITASYPFMKFNKETIFYTEMNTFYILYTTSYKARIDTVLYNTYSDNDLRKTAYFTTNSDGYQQFKGSYAQSSICFSGIAVDEMYLTRAECLIRTGNIENGLDDLNFLLKKRYKEGTFVFYTGLSQQEALNLILQEREKELVMRGLRWMDLKRLNKEGANIVLKRITEDKQYTLLPNSNFYALPIPEDIIQLTGMPQNDL